MYPGGYATYIEVERLTEHLCGASRPGHFRGVATVVTKLFAAVKPHVAIFGQKDAQQAAVIRRMVRDLNLDVAVMVSPIFREADGLAMSSRNTNLSSEARKQATCLYRALSAAQKAFENGQRDANRLKALMLDVINSTELAQPDYVSVADPDTLEELDTIATRALLSMAVFVGGVRLIDNMEVG